MKCKVYRYAYAVIIWIAYWLSLDVYGQSKDMLPIEKLAVKAKVSKDSISLRWAPLDIDTWQKGNRLGYKIERFTIARNGAVLPEHEKLLIATGVKLLPLAQWEILVKQDQYAAIAAQAFFGDQFEIDLRGGDAFTIVNKVRENEQRFSFALFCADMSPAVAKASGLYITDKNISKNEKYLYRVTVNSIDSLSGSAFISGHDIPELPKPVNLKAEYQNQIVSLRWNRNQTLDFSAYIVEKSADGKEFKPISEIPLATVSPLGLNETRYEYAIDSLQEPDKTYYYRVKGLTAFGESSAPSDIIAVHTAPPVNFIPHITKAENIKNNSIQISWEFDEKRNENIKGFSIDRSSKAQGSFTAILQHLLPSTTRVFLDRNPGQVNYYRVSVIGLDGARFTSPVFLAQLIDSIPPSPPIGLHATVNELGKLKLFWEPNKETDIHGYRIYRGNSDREELSQITLEPISGNFFSDEFNRNQLNESVYYAVMAIDNSQNHSPLSAILKVKLPDLIRPQPPVFHSTRSDERGIHLKWVKSSSEDVGQYRIYRKASNAQEWVHLNSIHALTDTIFAFTDSTGDDGANYAFTVTAVDEANLESDPTEPILRSMINNSLPEAVLWNVPKFNQEARELRLQWTYTEQNVKFFRIYKATENTDLTMYRTVPANRRQINEYIVPGKQYTYCIIAVFENDSKSKLSKELNFKY